MEFVQTSAMDAVINYFTLQRANGMHIKFTSINLKKKDYLEELDVIKMDITNHIRACGLD